MKIVKFTVHNEYHPIRESLLYSSSPINDQSGEYVPLSEHVEKCMEHYRSGVEDGQRKNPSGCVCKIENDQLIEPCDFHLAEVKALVESMKQAVDDEEEYPGAMPDVVWFRLKSFAESKNRAMMTEALRLSVRNAKRNILERMKAAPKAAGEE